MSPSPKIDVTIQRSTFNSESGSPIELTVATANTTSVKFEMHSTEATFVASGYARGTEAAYDMWAALKVLAEQQLKGMS